MKKITIKKLDDEETFRKITTTITFEVNGKEVKVYEFSSFDSNGGTEEYDEEVDENDKEKLTEEELEVFEDELIDAKELKIGEQLQVDGWDEIGNEDEKSLEVKEQINKAKFG